jgi:hypothetical protein
MKILEIYKNDGEFYPRAEDVLALLSKKYDLVVASNIAT